MMKAFSFRTPQKGLFLKPGATGMPISDICRKAGISQANGFQPSGRMRRLKQRKNGNCVAH